jgi:peptidylprolyl isomerase
MNKLNRNEWIAVFASVGLMTYVFFSDPLVGLFSSNSTSQDNQRVMNSQTSLESREVTVGTGEIAEPGDKITAHYVGVLPDGQVFDSSYERGSSVSFTLGVGQVIRGWDEGVQGMREGGKRQLKIYPEYGYGANAVGAIPPNSTLIFEVELIDVEKQGQ